jgi:DNA polymerase-3 subunit gamma/tau
MNDSDSDDCGGQGPKKLKPLFNKNEQNSSQPSAATASGVSKPATSVHSQTTQEPRPVAGTTTPTAPIETRSAPQPAAQVVQGRPEGLRRANDNKGGLGRMFQRSRESIENGNTTTATTPKANSEQRVTNTPIQESTGVEITNALLVQAWTSFALQLPENERALADRMKIMQPQLESDGSFTLSVDNQMVAELFTSEERRIVEGMSPLLGGAKPKMRIIINKVVVERHVSDKTKQFAILIEKNPLIDKLRKDLNLEIAR